MHKKGHKLKTSPLLKNPQFSSNLADIQAKLPTKKTIILTKFHKECKKIVEFSLRQRFLACALFLCITPYVMRIAMAFFDFKILKKIPLLHIIG